TRRGLDVSPTLFLCQSRTTSVDVMAVTNTTRPVTASSERRRTQVLLPHGCNTSTNHAEAPTTTALAVKQTAAMRAKINKGMKRERQEFMQRLSHEREHRVHLESWAASRIQAIFRGYLVRPRPPRQRGRHHVSPEESNRLLLVDIQAILVGAGLPTIPGMSLDGRYLRSSNGGGWSRATLRPRSRKQRVMQHEQATQITRVVRGFLERRRVGYRWREWERTRQWEAAQLIQHAWRGYWKRKGWYDLESGLRDDAACMIQTRFRGMSCRMAIAIKKKNCFALKRKTEAATSIQAVVR
ncbi:unnamed protein product, partial [Choristocarpus tenellus]